MSSAAVCAPYSAVSVGSTVATDDGVVVDAQAALGDLVDGAFGLAAPDGERLHDDVEQIEVDVTLHRRLELGEGVGQQARAIPLGPQERHAFEHGVDHRVPARCEESIHLVAAQREAVFGGPWIEQILNRRHGDLTAFGAVPRMIRPAVSRPEDHLVHHGGVDAVRGGDRAQLVGDRRDQDAAEVEDHCCESVAVPGHPGSGNFGHQSNDAVALPSAL